MIVVKFSVEIPKTFRCNVCGKMFLLQWRLKKHIDNHEKKTRKCKFFINKEACPFSDIGCKFGHEDHDEESSEAEEPIVNDETDQQEKSDESDSVTYGENDCHLCEETFTCLDDLCDHFQSNHEEYYMKTQNLVVF